MGLADVRAAALQVVTGWRLAGGLRSVDDDLGDDAGGGDHGQVRRVDFGDVRVRAGGHEQLLGRGDDVILGADHGPGRDGRPGRRA